MEAWSGELGVGAIALLVLYIAVRDVVAPLVRHRLGGDGGDRLDGESRKAIYETRECVGQMHDWQKPDAKGAQPWRGYAMIDVLANNTEAIKELRGEIRQATEMRAEILRYLKKVNGQ